MSGDRDYDATDEANGRQDDAVKAAHGIDGNVVTRRAIYYIASFVIALLVLRIALLLLAANKNFAFVDFIYTVSSIFAWPFFGVFSYQPTHGRSTLEIGSVIAIAIYALIAVTLATLFTHTSRGDE